MSARIEEEGSFSLGTAMGLHAFVTEPGHCAVYRAIRGTVLPRMIGFDERWNMPVARHTLALSGDVEFRGVD